MKLTKTEKASTTKTASTQSPKRNVKATTARQANVAKVFAHFREGFTAYEPEAGKPVTGAQRRVLIVAAMVATGFAKLNKASIAAGTSGNATLFKALVGATPYRYHSSSKRMTDSALTAAGVEWFTARFHGEDDYKLAAAMVTAMTKGGKVETLDFNRAIASK